MWAALLTCALIPRRALRNRPLLPTVGVAIADKRPIARTIDFVGRVEAINRVDVRARVKGYLDAVLFKEGDLVKEGAPLYRIEKGLLQAAVEQAQGALETSKALHELAIKEEPPPPGGAVRQERQRRQSPGRSRRIGGRDQGRHHDE